MYTSFNPSSKYRGWRFAGMVSSLTAAVLILSTFITGTLTAALPQLLLSVLAMALAVVVGWLARGLFDTAIYQDSDG